MRRFYFPIYLLLIFASCFPQNDRKLEIKILERTISKSQSNIENLVDSFKKEHSQFYSESSIDSLADKYNLRLFNLLTSNGMDSILVHIDSVKEENRMVTTVFHLRKDIVVKYGLRFIDSLTKKQDSLFSFMKNLKPGIDTTINFQYMGSHQFKAPSDTSSYALKIFAFPTLFPSSRHYSE